MTGELWWECLFDGRTRGFITISATMIVIGLGLEVYGLLIHGPTTLGGLLLVLLLAFWSRVIGAVCFALATASLMSRAMTNCRED